MLQKKFYQDLKIGVLGGGQLGRMLIQEAINLNINFHVLDSDADAPCKHIATKFVHGSITDYETVLDFGKNLDLLTIEIENVNTDALFELVRLGVVVYPQPNVIKLIQDKRVQKQFYIDNQIPTAEFVLINHKSELANHNGLLPAFLKLGKAGYDGKGVLAIHTAADFAKAFDAPSLLEKKNRF